MPLENTTPGNLNRSTDVPRLNVQKCKECGQFLPIRNRTPAREPWSSGLFACAQDRESCWMGLFCPCVLFGRNVELVRDDCMWILPCICHAVFVEGGLALAAVAALPGFINPVTDSCFPGILLVGWVMSGLCTTTVRESLQDKYHLKKRPCDPCLVHSFMHWCAICQEYRELKARITYDAEMPVAIVNPPPVQEMNGGDTTPANIELRALQMPSV